MAVVFYHVKRKIISLKNIYLKNKKCLKISINNAEFNCWVLGNGAKNIISFHGFGQDHEAYTILDDNCSDCTIYSFDLPFHGSTKIYKKNSVLIPDDLGELMTQLLNKAGISRFSIIAFSIGAKMALPIIEKFASMIDRVWLLAPDGIQPNFWYHLVTGNRVMRFIFQKAMRNPGMVLGGARLLKSVRILNRQIVAMTVKSINTQEQRDLVFHTWTYLRNIHYHQKSLIKVLRQNGISVIFILGKYDRVIPASGIEKISNTLDNAEIVKLPCGHFNLIKSFSDWMVRNDQRL